MLRKRLLNRQEMLQLLGELASVKDESLVTIYLPPAHPPAATEDFIKKLNAPPETTAQLAEKAIASRTGGLIFWGTQKRLLVIPPLAVEKAEITRGAATAWLEEKLRKDHLLALVLVRLGAYAIGIYRGERQLGSKVGTGLIHGRHRQGGSSARRFARHREKQIEAFLTRVCQHARKLIEPHAGELDYVVYGGARTTIQLLLKQCPLLADLKVTVLPPLLDIPEPRQVVLEEAIDRIWSSAVYVYQENEENPTLPLRV